MLKRLPHLSHKRRERAQLVRYFWAFFLSLLSLRVSDDHIFVRHQSDNKLRISDRPMQFSPRQRCPRISTTIQIGIIREVGFDYQG